MCFLLVTAVHQSIVRVPTPREIRVCPLHPEIERIVEENVRQNWANHAPYTKGNFQFERTVTGWRARYPDEFQLRNISLSLPIQKHGSFVEKLNWLTPRVPNPGSRLSPLAAADVLQDNNRVIDLLDQGSVAENPRVSGVVDRATVWESQYKPDGSS